MKDYDSSDLDECLFATHPPQNQPNEYKAGRGGDERIPIPGVFLQSLHENTSNIAEAHQMSRHISRNRIGSDNHKAESPPLKTHYVDD